MSWLKVIFRAVKIAAAINDLLPVIEKIIEIVAEAHEAIKKRELKKADAIDMLENIYEILDELEPILKKLVGKKA